MPSDADEPVFDEEFIRGAAFTEPSAQERSRPPGRLRRMRDRRALRRSGPSGRAGRRGLGGRGPLGRRRRRERREPTHRRAVLQVIAGVAVLLMISTGLWWWNRPAPRDEADGSVIIEQGVPDGGNPGGAAPGAHGDPFAGSPAASYADGEAGIQMPDPKAANGLSEADLALAYVRVRKLIVAANLDPATVYERKPDAFRRLLDPAQRRTFDRDLDEKGEHNSRTWLTSFAAGTAERAVPTVKVHGTVTAAKARDQGRPGVKVTADHLFVYAVQRPGRPETAMREVVRRAIEVFVYREGGEVKLWLTRTDSSSAPSACDMGDGFVHPRYRDDRGGAPGGESHDPYDQSKPIQEDPECGQVTRV